MKMIKVVNLFNKLFYRKRRNAGLAKKTLLINRIKKLVQLWAERLVHAQALLQGSQTATQRGKTVQTRESHPWTRTSRRQGLKRQGRPQKQHPYQKVNHPQVNQQTHQQTQHQQTLFIHILPTRQPVQSPTTQNPKRKYLQSTQKQNEKL